MYFDDMAAIPKEDRKASFGPLFGIALVPNMLLFGGLAISGIVDFLTIFILTTVNYLGRRKNNLSMNKIADPKMISSVKQSFFSFGRN